MQFQSLVGVRGPRVAEVVQRLSLLIHAGVVCRGSETDRLVPPISPQQIDRLIGGDRIEPGSEAAARLELAAFAVQLQERVLKSVLCQLGVVQAAVQVACRFLAHRAGQAPRRRPGSPSRRSPATTPRHAVPATVDASEHRAMLLRSPSAWNRWFAWVTVLDSVRRTGALLVRLLDDGNEKTQAIASRW